MFMFKTIMLIPNMMIMMSIISFFISRKKILMCIMSMEFMLLNIFFMFIIYLSTTTQTLSHSIFMLSLGACEASLGLSLLINTTRFKGNDMLTNNSIKF